MATKEEVLDTAKKLIQQVRDLSAAPPGPFDQVSGTPALDALKLNGNVISDEELKKLLDGVDKAKVNEESWVAFAKSLGSFVGAVAKAVIVLLLAVLFVGCATPPAVRQAHQVEQQAFTAFKLDHDAVVNALLSDLALALETQIRLIEIYEIKAKGDPVNQAVLLPLLTAARAKREEVASKLEVHRAKIKSADGNYEIAVQIHTAIGQFLGHGSIDASDVDALAEQVSALKAQQTPSK